MLKVEKYNIWLPIQPYIYEKTLIAFAVKIWLPYALCIILHCKSHVSFYSLFNN